MDTAMITQVLALASLSGVINGKERDISDATKGKLVTACHDRAILLTEITDYVLVTHLQIPPEELEDIHHIQAEVANSHPLEALVIGRHIPVAVPRIASQNINEATHSLMPPSWDFLDARAAGILLSAEHLGQVFNDVFEEHIRLSLKNDYTTSQRQAWRFTVAQRCIASGLENLIPTVVLTKDDPSGVHRQTRGRPMARIRKKQRVDTSSHPLAWRFTGHIAAILEVRAKLTSIEGSWPTTKSEILAWGAFIDQYYPNIPHFPVTSSRISAFLSFFDNASSAKKYITAIRKATDLQAVDFINDRDLKKIMEGISKLSIKAEQSFITGKVLIPINEYIIERTKRIDLAQFTSVCYTFQLRVPSEGIMLEVSEPELGLLDVWHSHIEEEKDGSVSIRLKKRKNNNLPSKVRRYCICKVWQRKPICGVCILKHILATRAKGHRGRVFPDVQIRDIRILKDIAVKAHLGTVTWHGLRRGRTDDIVNGLDNPSNPSASIEDVAESLGHKLGRASFFSYIKKDSASKQHFGRHLAAQSDSD